MGASQLKCLLQVKDLSVSFVSPDGICQAVRDVSFNLYKGESVALVGESGCGKSALSQALIKVISSPPAKITSGSILFDGIDLLRIPEKKLRAIRGKEIAMVFQDSMASLNPTMKIGRQIIEAIDRHLTLSKDALKQRAIDLLQAVGISAPEQRFNQYPHELSGGMRQRIGMAVAMSCHPHLLIADEPTTALDVTIQAQILDLMQAVQTTLNMTVLLITHDLGVVAQSCDRMLVMYAGKIVEEGSCLRLFKDPCHPYTFGLLQSVPRITGPLQNKLVSIKGTPPDLMQPPSGCPYYSRCPYAMNICKDQMPPAFEIAEGQRAACWLHDTRAQKSNARFQSDKINSAR